MRRHPIAATVIASIVLAGLVYSAYRFGMSRGMSMAPASVATSTDAAPQVNERRILYWHDPMVPGHRFDKPGKSPFMDMQLVPVYADEAQGPGVTVSPAMAQSLGVRTTMVRKGAVESTIEAAGTVVQNERATVVVQSRATGYVEKLFVRAALDPVARGQPLVTIFVPEWAGALTEYVGLRAAKLDPALVSAARERLRLLSIPDDVVERAERDGTIQSRFTLTSPTSGVIAELGVRDGAMVQPGMALFRVVDLSSVWVEASVPEAQAAQVREGGAAQAKADAYSDRTFSGKVSAILPQVDPATRTLRARLEVRNPGMLLKPGMFVRVTLGSQASEPVLLVPQEAVIATGKRNVVIVAAENQRFVPVEVVTGRPVGADVEVKSGLTEGQRIVTSGQFLIDSEASLKSTLSRLEAATPDGKATSAAPGATAGGPYRGEGRVEKIGSDELVLSHGPIAALNWPSMTMGFKNPAEGLPKDLAAGDQVRFEFVQRDGSYRLSRIERIAGGSGR